MAEYAIEHGDAQVVVEQHQVRRRARREPPLRQPQEIGGGEGEPPLSEPVRWNAVPGGDQLCTKESWFVPVR